MLPHLRAVILGALLAISAPALSRAQEMQLMQSNQATLIRSLLPMVVNITAVIVSAPTEAPQVASAPADPPSTPKQSRQLGSGFVIDPSGVIATNYHVIDGAYEVTVTFSDGMQLAAKVLSADRLADIALLKVDSPRPLKAVEWGDSSTIQVGDPVLAIGNPLGVGLSVTGGIVSALNRNIMESPYDDYIQTDAPINHGNSGGPLFNMKGQVVGIDSALISPTAGSAGLGFAIPSRDAQFVIGQLREYGSLHPGWVGLKVQQVTPPIADALGMEVPQGALVAEVVKDGPAAKADLEVGDIIIRFDGLAPSDERALLRAIASSNPGEHITLTVLRDGKSRDLHATVAEWPRQSWEHFDAPVGPVKVALTVPTDLGIKVAKLSSATRASLNMDPKDPAVLITAVQPGTDAAWHGVAEGDALLRVQDRDIGSPADFKAALDTDRRLGRNFVLVLVWPKKQVTPGPEWYPLRIRQ
jgi:serine protease Do